MREQRRWGGGEVVESEAEEGCDFPTGLERLNAKFNGAIRWNHKSQKGGKVFEGRNTHTGLHRSPSPLRLQITPQSNRKLTTATQN